jgi:hypothetical protein
MLLHFEHVKSFFLAALMISDDVTLYVVRPR